MRKKVFHSLGMILGCMLCILALVSGTTYAKYVQKMSGHDQAKVASFINNVSTDHETLTQDTNLTLWEDIIAPGSQGEFVLHVVDQSEVQVQALMTLELDNPQEIPLRFSYQGTTYEDLALLNQRLNQVLEEEFKKGPTSNIDIELSIGWEWPFFISDEQDEKDTQIASSTSTVTLHVSCTFMQVVSES